MTPFGFAFDRHDNLIVSEAFGGAAGASATSSYELDGAAYPLEAVSPTVNVGQTAACWVVVTKNGRYRLRDQHRQQHDHRLQHRA